MRTSTARSTCTALATCLAAAPLALGAPGVAVDDPVDAEALVQRARALGIAQRDAWLRLGHWRAHRAWLVGPTRWRSEADGAALFLAPDGARDPAAELDATIRAFSADGPDDELDAVGPAVHARCRFPARFLYLTRALDLDPTRLPAPSCARYRRYLDEVDAASAALVFSSYFMNNPASALGHTFLRLDRAGPVTVGMRRQLLDTGIDFGANVDDSNAFVYAVKGVFGLYPGTFRRMPYYYKVRQYADYESRDLWEYELALDPFQLQMLVAHLWELGSTHFDYYYLDENCSYHVLGALAAAVPEAHLLERTRVPVVPADTVAVVASTPGLVRRVDYRPAVRTQLGVRLARLDPAARRVVGRLADDPDAPLPAGFTDAQRIDALDAAADAIDVEHARELLRKEDGDAAEHKRRLLERRAAILRPSPPLDAPVPEEKRPDRGHGSRRVGVGAALAEGGRTSVAFDARAALHDLGDPSEGYPDLSEIEFLAARFRVSTAESPRFTLDDAVVVRATSLTSLDRFARLPSWRFAVGARTLHDAGCHRCVAGNAVFGAGGAKATRDDAWSVFTLIDGVVESGDIDGIRGAPIRLGVGPWGGVRWRAHPGVTLLGIGSYRRYPGQRPRGLWTATASARVGLARDVAVGLEGTARDDDLRAQLMLYVYP